MLQIKKRKDGKRKWRFMTTICFYQDTRHRQPLIWIRDVCSIGYLSDRNDGMTELRINGYAQVAQILKDLLPFLQFKKIQANALYDASCILMNSKNLSEEDLRKLVKYMILIQENNYKTKSKRGEGELLKILDLTP